MGLNLALEKKWKSISQLERKSIPSFNTEHLFGSPHPIGWGIWYTAQYMDSQIIGLRPKILHSRLHTLEPYLGKLSPKSLKNMT